MGPILLIINTFTELVNKWMKKVSLKGWDIEGRGFNANNSCPTLRPVANDCYNIY